MSVAERLARAALRGFFRTEGFVKMTDAERQRAVKAISLELAKIKAEEVEKTSKFFASRWNADYWTPGNHVYEHYQKLALGKV